VVRSPQGPTFRSGVLESVRMPVHADPRTTGTFDTPLPEE